MLLNFHGRRGTGAPMAWRFRRSVRLLPGVRLNFSGGGVTTTLGPRGAHVTLGGKRTRVSTGIPGTGVSHSTLLPSRPRLGQRSGSGGLWLVALIVVVAIARCGNSDHRAITTSPAVVRAQAPVQATLPETFSDFSVAAAALNVRDAPDGRLVGRATRGNTVHVYESRDEWARVSTRDEAPRWVSRKGICSGAGCVVRGASASNTQPASPPPLVTPVSRTLVSPAPSRRTASTDYGCACSSGRTCVGPRGGVYCLTSGGNKRYVGRR